MCGAQRSKHTLQCGVEKCLALIKTTPEVFADNATEGGFFECVTRVLKSPRSAAVVWKGASPSSRVCSMRCWRATTSRATSRGGRCSARPGLRRRGQDGKRGALWRSSRCVLERLIDETTAPKVDEQVWTALSDAVVPRVHDKVAGVRSEPPVLALLNASAQQPAGRLRFGRALAGTRRPRSKPRQLAPEWVEEDRGTTRGSVPALRTVRKAAFDAR